MDWKSARPWLQATIGDEAGIFQRIIRSTEHRVLRTAPNRFVTVMPFVSMTLNGSYQESHVHRF
jgi:hypothetical protein